MDAEADHRERKSIPARALKERLAQKVAEIEKTAGRKVGRKEQKEMKESLELELLPHAFSKKNSTLVWLDLVNRFVVVGSASTKVADEVTTALLEATHEMGSLMPISQLHTNVSPSASMSGWLLEKDTPAGFTLDRDLELRQPDEEKASVRYARHNLEIDEIGDHIRGGKIPTQIALTWDNRISFALAQDGCLKKLQLLDVVFEDSNPADKGFEADMAIFTGEMSNLLPAIIEALSGELKVSG